MGGLSTSSGLPRRLSKPQASTSSSLFPASDQDLDITSPISINRQDYFGDYDAVVCSQGERRSRRKSRSRIRAYLYGSNSESTQTQSDEEDGQNTIADSARDVRKRLSRTGSSIMQLQSARASTAQLSDPSSSRLHLNGSQSSDPEESAMVADQIKERAHHDRLAAQNHVSSPVDERKHVDSVMAPLRRKSLYTPGLATRNASDILKKPPQPEMNHLPSHHNYYYDPARPKESPLAQLAALDLGEDGRSTPSNINYSQLGGLQLGTLRVTNGSASPTPRSSTPDSVAWELGSRSQDEYYTASEGSVVGGASKRSSRNENDQLSAKKQSPLSQVDVRGSITPRPTYPSQTPDRAVSMAYEYISELEISPFAGRDTPRRSAEGVSPEEGGKVIPQTGSPAVDVWRQFIDDAEIRHGGNEAQENALHKLNSRASAMPVSRRLSVPCSTDSRYITSTDTPNTDSGYGSKTSLNAGPTVTQRSIESPLSAVTSPKPSQTSAQTSPKMQESAGVSDGNTPTASPSLVRRHGGTAEPSETNYRMRQTSTVNSKLFTGTRCISGPREMPRPGSEQGKSPSQRRSQTSSSHPSSIMPQETIVNSVPSTANSSPIVARKLRKSRPKSQPPPANIIVQSCRELTEAEIPRVPSVVAARHADRLRLFPLLDHTFPIPQHTILGNSILATAADITICSVPIRFPSPASASEVAFMGDPQKPTKTDGGRRSRLRALSLSRTSAGVPDEVSNSISRGSFKHRHSVIGQAPDGEWSASGIVRSPSWSDFGGGRKKKEQKRLIKEEKEDEKRLAKEERELQKRLEKDRKVLMTQKKDEERQISAHSRSASRSRAASQDRSSQHDTMATVADFGTVTESLGGSPYDIATAMFPVPNIAHSGGNRHPHQISSASSRPRSVAGMDATAAAEAARTRDRALSHSDGRPRFTNEGTHDCQGSDQTILRRQTMFVHTPPVPALAAVDLQAHDVDWARRRQRSRSVTVARAPTIGAITDRRGLPGHSSRPQSLYVNPPPVPALPSAEQVKEREAQITKSRPQSKIIDTPPASTLPTPQSDSDEKTHSASSLVAGSSRPKANAFVPNLWCHGSLEKKGTRTVARPVVSEAGAGAGADASLTEEHPIPGEDNVWKAQIQAWRMRRKSAGEALLRNQITEIFDSPTTKSDPSPPHEQRQPPPPPARAFTTDPQCFVRQNEVPMSGGSPLAPFPNPLASHPPHKESVIADVVQPKFTPNEAAAHPRDNSQPTMRPGPSPLVQRQADPATQTQPQRRATTFTVPRKRVGSGTSTPTKTIDRLTGRHNGGLLYGYEPGSGLGGSAGTRGPQTAASRKSVDVSKGFGLDLSDVPIFVAPTIAR